MNQHLFLSKLLAGAITLASMHTLHAAVADIIGDTGSAQSGSLTLSGGSSGATFDSTGSTITQSFDFINLPATTATNGQIIINTEPVFHKYPAGSNNSFIGSFAGNFTMSSAAENNLGVGYSALNSLTDGNNNEAFGRASLINVTTGSGNIGVGAASGSGLTTGNAHLLIGQGAGASYTSEYSNITIGANPGVAGENKTIRIGDGQNQEACFIDGIYGALVDPDSALLVFADQVGKLGTDLYILSIVNSIPDVFNSAKSVLKLTPGCTVSKGKKMSFLLDPATVYKVIPELVVLDKKGNPKGIKYPSLQVLMLNELQRQATYITKLEARIAKLEKCILNH